MNYQHVYVDPRGVVSFVGGDPVDLPVADASAALAGVLATIRRRRAGLLSASDWTQVADAPLTDVQKTAWRAYRQALRDLPSAVAALPDPLAFAWPVAPA